MDGEPAQERGSVLKGIPFSVILSVSALIIGSIVAFWFVIQFVDSERQRDVREWQIRLGIVADSRHAAVEKWIDDQYGTLVSLSQNSSLQFYGMDLLAASESESEDTSVDWNDVAEAQYLFNLLTVTAEREGIASPPSQTGVDANVSRIGDTGIALLNLKGEILVASQGMMGIEKSLAAEIASLPLAKRGLIDLYLDVSGQPVMGFSAPVFSVQGDKTANDQVATLLTLRHVAKGLYPLLKQPGVTEKTAEGILVQETNGIVEYLSPLSGDAELMKLTISIDADDVLAAGFAINKPGGFAIKTDYQNHEVLVVSRKIIGAPWTLLYKVDRAEVLAESDSRLQEILIIGIIVVILLLAVIVAAWRYGASVRSDRAMQQFRESSILFENILKFMRVLADNMPAEIFAISQDGKYTFANWTAANNANTSPQDMKGKTLASVLGPAKAKAYGETNLTSANNQKKVEQVIHLDTENGGQICKVSSIPLTGEANSPSGTLMVVDDITELLQQQELQRKGMRQLIQALVILLDQRDPYSTVHSAVVAKLAAGTAVDMGLCEDDCHTIELAANLIHIGKAVVPRDVLTKSGKLSRDEKTFVKDSIGIASELIHNVDFGLPVVDTLGYVREYWDGSGPHGLKGEEIPLTSRLIACTSALVGMVSPRAYREAVPYNSALATLLNESDPHFGPHVLSALANHIENHGGMEIIEFVLQTSKKELTTEGLIEVINKLGHEI